MSNVVIVGGGAAGMAAAIAAAGIGHEVHLYEKNEKLGKKVYITGKGRCNVTNACDMETMLQNVVTNPRFLYSSFYGFTNQDIMDLLERNGCPVKTERGNRVFPVSDKSSDVISALSRQMRDLNVDVHLHSEVKDLLIEDGHCVGIRLKKNNTKVFADAVIVATGGISYPSTGSTGDGYRFAQESGHIVEKTYPSLIPFNVKEDYIMQMQGLALKNVTLTIKKGKKTVYDELGEMLFTHFGVSGPIVLSASSLISGNDVSQYQASIDLKPALSKQQLDERILRDFKNASNSFFKNSLGKLLPAKMIPVIVLLSGIPEDKKVNEITKEERKTLVQLIKEFPFTIESLRGYNEAIITRGGVSIKEINPGTMESKKVANLYFAGEVLDLDAKTGGYNLQIAWSTGYLAGLSVQ